MSVWLHSFKEYANVLRLLTSRDSCDEIYFGSAQLAERHGICGVHAFGVDSFERVVMDPRFQVHLVSEDAIGLGKVWLANVRAYNAAAAGARTPRKGEPEHSVDYAARRILLAALRSGLLKDAARTMEAIETIQLMRGNTEYDDDFAATVDGASEYLTSAEHQAYCVLADMWRHGDKVPR